MGGLVDVVSSSKAIRLASNLEHAVATADSVRVRASLVQLREALLASVVNAGPRERPIIDGLLVELDALEAQLPSGHVRWLGGIERQCRILSRV